MANPPGGKPIPGITNADDVRWALDKARRFIFRGGDRTDPRFRRYVDRWLDFANESEEQTGTAPKPFHPDSNTEVADER